MPSAFSHPGEGDSSSLIYFSFVRLTTLGYGDIVPMAFLDRSLAVVEAIVGQPYLAILIAGLVGSNLADRSRSGASPDA